MRAGVEAIVRIRSLVLGGSLVVGAAIPGAAIAAAPAGGGTFTIEGSLWTCAFSGGGAPSDATLTITLERASGTTVGSRDVVANGAGNWMASFCPSGAGDIRPGDIINVKDTEAVQATFTVPDVMPRTNPATNVVTVRHDVAATAIDVTPYDCVAGLMCEPGTPLIPTGTPFRVDTDPADLRGGDLVQVDILYNSGQQRWIVTAPVPFVAAQNGSPKVTGIAKPGTTVTVTVRGKNGTVRGTGSAKANGPKGAFKVTVRKNGKAVKVRPGDRVSASIYQNANIRTVAGSIAIEPATGMISGTCAPNVPVLVSWPGPSNTLYGSQTTSGTGTFDFNAAAVGLPLPSGFWAEARCENAQGNQQLLKTKVP